MNLPLKVAATQPCEAEAETVCARRRETSLLDRRAAGRTLTRRRRLFLDANNRCACLHDDGATRPAPVLRQAQKPGGNFV